MFYVTRESLDSTKSHDEEILFSLLIVFEKMVQSSRKTVKGTSEWPEKDGIWLKLHFNVVGFYQNLYCWEGDSHICVGLYWHTVKYSVVIVWATNMGHLQPLCIPFL